MYIYPWHILTKMLWTCLASLEVYSLHCILVAFLHEDSSNTCRKQSLVVVSSVSHNGEPSWDICKAIPVITDLVISKQILKAPDGTSRLLSTDPLFHQRAQPREVFSFWFKFAPSVSETYNLSKNAQLDFMFQI